MKLWELGRTRLAFSAVMLLVLGLDGVVLWAGGRAYVDGQRGQASATWPAAQGTVLSARYQPTENRGRNSTSCASKVTYRYDVGGQEFSGDRVSFGWNHDCDDNQTFVWRHPAGSSIQVYYQPSDPSVSVLVPGGSTDGLVLFYVCIGLLLSIPTLLLFAVIVVLFVPNRWEKPIRDWNVARRKRREALEQNLAPARRRKRRRK